MRDHRIKAGILMLALLLCGCAALPGAGERTAGGTGAQTGGKAESQASGTPGPQTAGAPGKEEQKEGEEPKTAETMTAEAEYLDFFDAYGDPYRAKINPHVEKHPYDCSYFQRDGQKLAYVGDARYTSRLGVDVSHHQGRIDWPKVKAAGYDFAFIRLGYRGYGAEGALGLDREYQENLQNARAAGLDVGVYFFAQAVNEEEAAEEARFVLDNLAGSELQLPVVYDPESILDDEARTDDVSGEQFTRNTAVFCQTIQEAGYQPMIYCNMLWEAFELDLTRLTEYPIWYADYEPLPQTPYRFTFWQYSNTGTVDGISGSADLNIQLMKAGN